MASARLLAKPEALRQPAATHSRSGVAAMLFLLVAALVAGHASPAPPARSAANTPSAAAARPDVILVTIDTLRADATGFGGNRNGTTPLLDRFAAGGRVFTNAHAHNVVTLPSHTNILTGLYPYQHGVRENSGFRLGAGIPTLATALAGRRLRHRRLRRRLSARRAFRPRARLRRPTTTASPAAASTTSSRCRAARRRRGEGGARLVAVACKASRASSGSTSTTRTRRTCRRRRSRAASRDPYLGEVAAADAFLQPLLDPCSPPARRPTLMVVTADHGEALRRSRRADARPLRLRGDAARAAAGVGARYDESGTRVTRAATTARRGTSTSSRPSSPRPASRRRPADRRGRAARCCAPGPLPSEPPTSTSSRCPPPSTAAGRRCAGRSCASGAGKFIHLPLPELYDLPRDPGEQKNLVDADRPAVRAAFAALPRESQWPPPREAISSEESARLRSLGYVAEGGGDTIAFTPADDPKNLVALDRRIEEVIDAYSRGALRAAVTMARELVQERPVDAARPLPARASAAAVGRTTTKPCKRCVRARAAKVASPSLLRQLGLSLAERGAHRRGARRPRAPRRRRTTTRPKWRSPSPTPKPATSVRRSPASSACSSPIPATPAPGRRGPRRAAPAALDQRPRRRPPRRRPADRPPPRLERPRRRPLPTRRRPRRPRRLATRRRPRPSPVGRALEPRRAGISPRPPRRRAPPFNASSTRRRATAATISPNRASSLRCRREADHRRDLGSAFDERRASTSAGTSHDVGAPAGGPQPAQPSSASTDGIPPGRRGPTSGLARRSHIRCDAAPPPTPRLPLPPPFSRSPSRRERPRPLHAPRPPRHPHRRSRSTPSAPTTSPPTATKESTLRTSTPCAAKPSSTPTPTPRPR